MNAELALPIETDLLPALPWRDPYTLSTEELAGCIRDLEAACASQPKSASLRTCLGMAYAMNYDVYKSMDALEAARALEPQHFFAQFKFAELNYRLRALIVAEAETLKALALATDHWQLTMARKQLADIRKLMRDGTQKPEWTRSFGSPYVWLAATLVLLLTLWVRFH